MTTTDLIIIGCGPGGYQAAPYAAKHGLQVTVIEESHVGGTCLNVGCIPTKAYCHEAEVIEQARRAAEHGLVGLSFSLNFAKIQEHKNQVVQQLRSGVETLMAMPGINFVQGKASFKDAHTVVVGNEEYRAGHIIIATGSYSKMPPIEGIDSPGVVTSAELLDIDYVPSRLVIVGAGVIGLEFASAFNTFGSQVTVIEFLKECLPAMDSDIAKRLRKQLERRGVQFFMQSGVKSIDNGTVTFETKGKVNTVGADTILIATGRGANVDGLKLENAGIAYDRQGIKTDENMQTNVEGVYAIGDVNGRMMLAHAATFQGYRAVNHILGLADDIRLDIMPAAVFTNPEAASVGKTEDALKAEGTEYKAHKGYYRANGKAVATGETEGMVKILTDLSGRIIGCHVLGAHASGMVQEITALMNRDTTLQQLGDIIHTHPTLEEILHDTAH